MSEGTLVREYETETAVYREYVYDNGGRMTVVSLKDEQSTPAAHRESPRLVPGAAAATEAFVEGAEEQYIDGMRDRFGGEW